MGGAKEWRCVVGGAKEWRRTVWAELKSEGVSWAELKSDEHLRRSPTKQRHLMPFHSPSAVLNHDRDLLYRVPTGFGKVWNLI